MLRQTVDSIVTEVRNALEGWRGQRDRLDFVEHGTTAIEDKVWEYSVELCNLEISLCERQLEVCADYKLEDGLVQPVAPLLSLLNGGDESVHVLQERIEAVETELHPLQRDTKIQSMENMQEEQVDEVQEKIRNMIKTWTKPKSKHCLQLQGTLKDTASPEGQTIACFINRYWTVMQDGNVCNVGDYEAAHRKACSFKHLHPYSSTIVGVLDFISGMRDHITLAYPDLAVESNDIDIALEDFIFPQIYTKCLESVLQAEDDALLDAQCEKYAKATQAQMDIPPKLRSPERVPFAMASAKLKSVYFSLSPFRKLIAVHAAVQTIFADLEKLCPKEPISTDMFLPVFIYVVVQSKVHKLATSIAFITTFLDPGMMMGELGFILSSLEMAAEYIKSMSDDKLEEVESLVSGRPFVVCDRERYRTLSFTNSKFQIAKECVELRGYKLFAVEEWVWNPLQYYSTAVVETGDMEDSILVAVVRADSSPGQTAFLQNVFFSPKSPGVKAVETECGSLLVTDPSALSALTLLPLPDGDYERHRPALELQLSLKRLGCMSGGLSLKTPKEVEALFRREYEADLPHSYVGAEYVVTPSIDTPELVQMVVADVQQTLAHLDFFPIMCPVDGIFNSIVIASVTVFQRAWNEDGMGEAVRTDGFLDSDLVKNIHTFLESYCEKLAAAGFAPPDPTIDPAGFSSTVKEFQACSGVFSDGRIGRKTRVALDELMQAAHPGT